MSAFCCGIHQPGKGHGDRSFVIFGGRLRHSLQCGVDQKGKELRTHHTGGLPVRVDEKEGSEVPHWSIRFILGAIMSGHRQCCQAFTVLLDGGKSMTVKGVLDIAGYCEVGPGVWRLQGIMPEFHGQRRPGWRPHQGRHVGLSH